MNDDDLFSDLEAPTPEDSTMAPFFSGLVIGAACGIVMTLLTIWAAMEPIL